MNAWVKSPWGVAASQPQKPWFNESDEFKIKFAHLLAEGKQPFEAANSIFGQLANGASMWVAQHWPNDPFVILEKDKQIEELNKKKYNLDKEQYAVTLLQFAYEIYEHNGKRFYVNEGKDRLAALKLYGDAKGYLKEAIQPNTNTNIEKIEILVVKPEHKELKTINAVPNTNTKSEIANDPFEIKLVSGLNR